MKILILLLFCTTTISVVCAQIRFPLRALAPDLHAIEKYYQKGDKTLMAYIHWPNSVTIRAKYIWNLAGGSDYVRIDGDFKIAKKFFRPEKIEGLYYQYGRFYMKKNSEKIEKNYDQKDTVHLLPLDVSRTLIYKEPILHEQQPYVSIKYFSLEEIQQKADVVYNAYADHFHAVSKQNRAVFLATLSGSDGHFLEYTYPSDFRMPLGGDASKILVLEGSGKGSQLNIKDSYFAYQLIYDPKARTFKVPQEFDVKTNPEKNVVGVRMMNEAFLAEVNGPNKRLFSKQDLEFGTLLPDNSIIRKLDFLSKSSQVEPKREYAGFKRGYVPKTWPTGIQFQVNGIIFRKYANEKGGVLDKNCPFVIQREDEERFSLDNESGTAFCSNDYDVTLSK